MCTTWFNVLVFRALSPRFTLAFHVAVNHFLGEKYPAALGLIFYVREVVKFYIHLAKNSAANMKQQLMLKF